MSHVLSFKQQEKIAKFKYCGGDRSYIYAYCLSPLAQSLVDITPKWIPPNMITLMGLIFSIFSLILTMLYNPNLDKISCPNWVHSIVALNLFLYQTLDNMDGKQARKTGSSSPLGMLFDHGIDAINCSLLVLPLSSALGSGRTMLVVLFMMICFLPFYTTTWEEYYREEMVLGVINGPTEGLLILMIFLVATSIYGTESWHEEVTVPFLTPTVIPAGSTMFDILVGCFGIMMVCTVTPQLYIGEKELHYLCPVTSLIPSNCVITAAVEGYQRKGQHPLRTFVTLVPFIVFFGSFSIWAYLSKVALQEHLLITVRI